VPASIVETLRILTFRQMSLPLTYYADDAAQLFVFSRRPPSQRKVARTDVRLRRPGQGKFPPHRKSIKSIPNSTVPGASAGF
jgi:hypothetical protein